MAPACRGRVGRGNRRGPTIVVNDEPRRRALTSAGRADGLCRLRSLLTAGTVMSSRAAQIAA